MPPLPTSRRRGLPFAALLSILVLVYLVTRKSKPQPGEFDGATFKRSIAAIGDLHSYYPNALKALQLANVVDDQGTWTGNVDFLVQTGDLVDRGADTVKIYELFDRLRAEAEQRGGKVVSHLGNHEYMNLIGDWRYVYPSDLKTFDSVEDRQHAFSSQGWIGKTLYSNYTVTSRLPLHPSAGKGPYEDFDQSTSGHLPTWDAALSFLHGGIHPQLPFITPYPSYINKLGRSLASKLSSRSPMPPPHPPAPYPGLPQGVTPEEEELYGVNGPLWFRGWAQEPESDQLCKMAEETMAKMGVRRMIMGHTPNYEHMVSKCGGKIIVIDTGITPAYGGVLSALRIDYGLFPLMPIAPLAIGDQQILGSGGAAKRKYRELEVVTALYEGSSVELARSEKIIEGNFSM